MIAILTPHRKQAMISRGLNFCTILEVVLFYLLTVKSILSIHCYEYQASSRIHDVISGQNGVRGKTEHKGTVGFRVHLSMN